MSIFEKWTARAVRLASQWLKYYAYWLGLSSEQRRQVMQRMQELEGVPHG